MNISVFTQLLMAITVVIPILSSSAIILGGFMDCEYPFLFRENGYCVCPKTHPYRNGSSMCCKNDTSDPMACLCPLRSAYHSDSNGCYPINNTDFTIEINGKVTCPYANIKRRIGVGCCVYDDKFQKWCKCEDPNAVYNRLTGKCKQRLKLLHSRH